MVVVELADGPGVQGRAGANCSAAGVGRRSPPFDSSVCTGGNCSIGAEEIGSELAKGSEMLTLPLKVGLLQTDGKSLQRSRKSISVFLLAHRSIFISGRASSSAKSVTGCSLPPFSFLRRRGRLALCSLPSSLFAFLFLRGFVGCGDGWLAACFLSSLQAAFTSFGSACS